MGMFMYVLCTLSGTAWNIAYDAICSMIAIAVWIAQWPIGFYSNGSEINKWIVSREKLENVEHLCIDNL